jgi:hypothetical protein
LLVRFYKQVAPEEALNSLISCPAILTLSLEKRIKPRYRYAPIA